MRISAAAMAAVAAPSARISVVVSTGEAFSRPPRGKSRLSQSCYKVPRAAIVRAPRPAGS